MPGLIVQGGTMSSLSLLMIFAGALFAVPVIVIVLSLRERWSLHRK